MFVDLEAAVERVEEQWTPELVRMISQNGGAPAVARATLHLAFTLGACAIVALVEREAATVRPLRSAFDGAGLPVPGPGHLDVVPTPLPAVRWCEPRDAFERSMTSPSPLLEEVLGATGSANV